MLHLTHNKPKTLVRLTFAAFILSTAPCGVIARDLPPVEAAIQPSAVAPAKEADSFIVAPDAKISVEATGAPSVDGLGLQDSVQNPADSLATGWWKSSSAETLVDQIKHVPTRITSKPLRKLVVKALSSASDVSIPAKSSGLMLTARLEKLLEMGEWNTAKDILALVPQPLMTPGIRVFSNTLLWLEGKASEACKDIDTRMAKLEEPFWKQARVVCQLRDGKTDEAALAQEVLREQNRLPSAFVLDVYKRLTDGKSKVNWPSNYSLFDAALLTQVGVPDNAFKSVLQALPIGVSFRLAGAGRFVVSPAYKVPLLEVATEDGLASLEALMEAYRNLAIDPKTPGPGKKISPLILFVARAGFFQAMEKAATAEEKAKQLGTLVNSLNAAGLRTVSSALIHKNLEGVSPESLSDETFAALARPAVIAFIGDASKAKAWQQRMAESKNAAKTELAAQIGQVMQFAGGQEGIGKTPVSGRCGARINSLSAVFLQQTQTGGSIYSRTATNGESPSPILMNALREAAASGKKGETIILSAIALGTTPLEKLSDLVLTDVVRALKQAGFETEARGLALDAMLACVATL